MTSIEITLLQGYKYEVSEHRNKRIYKYIRSNNHTFYDFRPWLAMKCVLHLNIREISQGAKGTKIHVYLPYRGAISFYVYVVPLGLISRFLYVGRVQISCELLPTRFFLKFRYKTIIVKKGEISDSFIGKNTYFIEKIIKNYI